MFLNLLVFRCGTFVRSTIMHLAICFSIFKIKSKLNALNIIVHLISNEATWVQLATPPWWIFSNMRLQNGTL